MALRFGNFLTVALSILPFANAATASVPSYTAASEWETAQLENTVTAYTRFIVTNPDSPHVDDARRKISEVSGVTGTGDWGSIETLAKQIGLQDADRASSGRNASAIFLNV